MAIIRFFVIATIFVFNISLVEAQSIPPQLGSLAGQLYAQSKDELDDKSLSDDQKAAIGHAKKLLTKSRIANWPKSDVKIPSLSKRVGDILNLDPVDPKEGNAIIDIIGAQREDRVQLIKEYASLKNDEDVQKALSDIAKAEAETMQGMKKEHIYEGEKGEELNIKWEPQKKNIIIRASSDGTGKVPEYDVSLVGDTKGQINPETGELELSAKPARDPKRVYTKEDLERIRNSILGSWTEEKNGDIYTITAADDTAGDVRPTKSWYNQEIQKLKDRLQQTKKAKEFVWEHLETGEVVRQKRFRRLDEQYEYKGDQYLIENGEEAIAKLEQEIADMKAERDGATLPPAEKEDPVGYEKNKNSRNAKPIQIAVQNPNGHIYYFKEASFDGRKVAGRRTNTHVLDLTQDLPEPIKQELIASWNTPNWIELEAELNSVTGEIKLYGNQWSMYATYSVPGPFSNGYEVKNIHTPYTIPVSMRREGEKGFKTAWGAHDNLYP